MRGLLTRLIGPAIALDLHVPPAPTHVLCSIVHIEQILVNLVVNAKAAMPDGGSITITVEATDDTVTLTVADTGSGIDPAVMPQIFEPFFSTKGPSDGTGLGLATVFGHVQRMQGDIAVQSTLGVGTRFIVTLPVVADPVKDDGLSDSAERTT